LYRRRVGHFAAVPVAASRPRQHPLRQADKPIRRLSPVRCEPSVAAELVVSQPKTSQIPDADAAGERRALKMMKTRIVAQPGVAKVAGCLR
jgi:hypothetical protein